MALASDPLLGRKVEHTDVHVHPKAGATLPNVAQQRYLFLLPIQSSYGAYQY